MPPGDAEEEEEEREEGSVRPCLEGGKGFSDLRILTRSPYSGSVFFSGTKQRGKRVADRQSEHLS